MATYSITPETGGFAWYHSWLLSDGTWNDAGWWADVAAWQSNEGIGFGIGELGGSGVFSLSGQDVGKHIVDGHGVGSFAIAGQDALKNVSELLAGYFFTIGGQDINVGLLSSLDLGQFNISGQIASKSVSFESGSALYIWLHNWLLKDSIWSDSGLWVDAATWGALAGINFDIAKVSGSGVFVISGQSAPKGVLERIEFGEFILQMQDAYVKKDRVERDGANTVDAELPNANNSVSFTTLPNHVTVTNDMPNEAA